MVMSFAGLLAVSGVWLRASLAQTPNKAGRADQAVVPVPLKYPTSGFVPVPISSTLRQPTAYYGVMANPACAEQDAEVHKRVEEYRATQDEKERARIAKELPDLIAKEFDARQEAREQELKQLEEQLHKLKELHAKRGQQKEQIVEERVRQLLRDADGLGWGSEAEMQMNMSVSPMGVPGPARVYMNVEKKP
jgi:hypothetical protein